MAGRLQMPQQFVLRAMTVQLDNYTASLERTQMVHLVREHYSRAQMKFYALKVVRYLLA
jgi:hypothetical protein